MRAQRKQGNANTGQTAFVFEEASLTTREAAALPSDPGVAPLSTPLDYLPVYTVFLRRSNVLSVTERPQIRTPADVAALLWEFLKETDRENFVVLLLDTKNTVIGLNTASVGILDSALVHPREVFKPAILSNAASIILAHNHPSGDPTPSPEDRRITERMVDAGKLLAIDVLDHVIVGDKGRWVSLKERGLM